jgi:hypothetical protein
MFACAYYEYAKHNGTDKYILDALNYGWRAT